MPAGSARTRHQRRLGAQYGQMQVRDSLADFGTSYFTSGKVAEVIDLRLAGGN
jgi:hypothetical protein